MSQYEDKWINHQHVWVDKQYLPDIDADFFDPEYWHHKQALIGTSVGRGTTFFFKYGGNEFVLRHYLRGGLIGKMLTDQYLFTGLDTTRAQQERKLLQHMQSLGLPAPIPAASRIVKKGIYYSADLVTVKISDAVDVHHILLERALNSDIWQKVGQTIAQFHQHQIYHHDLNIHNIMLDGENQVWLIDFDKCSIKAGNEWKQSNLDRLLRSLQKEQQRNQGYFYQEENWQALIKGYELSSPD